MATGVWTVDTATARMLDERHAIGMDGEGTVGRGAWLRGPVVTEAGDVPTFHGMRTMRDLRDLGMRTAGRVSVNGRKVRAMIVRRYYRRPDGTTGEVDVILA